MSDTIEQTDWQRRFERSQRRWGNLKARIKQEIATFQAAGFQGQQRAAYDNRIAGLNWVLHEMQKSPDVLAEALPPETVGVDWGK
jgi:hypothetical protein